MTLQRCQPLQSGLANSVLLCVSPVGLCVWTATFHVMGNPNWQDVLPFLPWHHPLSPSPSSDAENVNSLGQACLIS